MAMLDMLGEQGEHSHPQVARRIRYAGDAKFKGVTSSFPVYEVDFVR